MVDHVGGEPVAAHGEHGARLARHGRDGVQPLEDEGGRAERLTGMCHAEAHALPPALPSHRALPHRRARLAPERVHRHRPAQHREPRVRLGLLRAQRACRGHLRHLRGRYHLREHVRREPLHRGAERRLVLRKKARERSGVARRALRRRARARLERRLCSAGGEHLRRRRDEAAVGLCGDKHRLTRAAVRDERRARRRARARLGQELG